VTPQVWFSPFPPYKVPWDPYVGSVDYLALFAPNAPWPKAAERTNVFEFWGWAVNEPNASMAEVRREVGALNARGIAISTQVSVLTPAGCGQGVEGFDGNLQADLDTIGRIAAAGGTVRFLSMDEPFYYASLYNGPHACHWSAQRVAREVAAYVRAIHAKYPAIQIGDIEPWPAGSWDDYARWLDAYRSASGAEFPFFHVDLDPNATGAGWPEQLRTIQSAVDARGVRFGIIYIGDDKQTDAAWVAEAQSIVDAYEVEGGGRPDDAIFQSWVDHPDYALPETKPDTFTHLVADYARTRTALSVAATATDTSGLRVSGAVDTLGGAPVRAATVGLSATPLDGPYQVLELQGTVPAGVAQAVVGVRVNMEGAGPGPADMTLYQLGYAEGSGPNLAPAPWVVEGLSSWGRCDAGTLDPAPSDRGTGEMVPIVLTASETLCVNSEPISVTPGAPYRLWVAARVPGASSGSGYAMVVFLGSSSGVESSRVILPLAPAPIALGTTSTDATGLFSMVSGALDPGPYRVSATFSGNGAYWPAPAAKVEAVVQ
jgi:hypothetical protein